MASQTHLSQLLAPNWSKLVSIVKIVQNWPLKGCLGTKALRPLPGRAGSGGSGLRRVPFPLIYFPLGCRCSLPPVGFSFLCWHGRYFACYVTRSFVLTWCRSAIWLISLPPGSSFPWSIPDRVMLSTRLLLQWPVCFARLWLFFDASFSMVLACLVPFGTTRYLMPTGPCE